MSAVFRQQLSEPVRIISFGLGREFPEDIPLEPQNESPSTFSENAASRSLSYISKSSRL